MQETIIEKSNISNKVRWAIIFIIIIILAGIAYAGYYFYQKNKPQTINVSTQTEQSSSQTATTSEDNSDKSILDQYNSYKTASTEKMASLQSLGESNLQAAMSLSQETKTYLEEFKTFLTENKTVLEKNNMNVTEDITTVDSNLALIASKGSSASSSLSRPSSSSSSLSIPLPFNKDNFVIANSGVWPFCVHGGDHPEGHGGIDFDLKSGTEIKAIADGKVERIEYVEGEGYNFMISHQSYGLASGYTPIVNHNLKVGDTITKDQVLGSAGTDLKGVPFLHFEIFSFSKNTRVCPYQYFDSDAKTAFDAMFAQSNYSEKSADPDICNCETVDVSTR